MACDVCGVCSLVCLETVAEKAVKCTHGRLAGVCKLLQRRRWAFCEEAGQLVSETSPAQKSCEGESHSCREDKSMAAAVEAAVC